MIWESIGCKGASYYVKQTECKYIQTFSYFLLRISEKEAFCQCAKPNNNNFASHDGYTNCVNVWNVICDEIRHIEYLACVAVFFFIHTLGKKNAANLMETD